MKTRLSNPVAFTPLPVTIISSLVYVALFAALLTTHLIVPSAPSNRTPISAVNLTEAWQDLQHISGEFHPYNSRQNDEIRDWLLRRIDQILATNTKSWMSDRSKYLHNAQYHASIASQSPAVVFSDVTSNVTFSREGKKGNATAGREPGLSVYFEGTNIIVYICGSEDGDEDWWINGREPPETGGVLVNAHYDSVSTGYGATDDGVGVVTILQMIKHFTAEGHKPKRGIVALLNNGEEDYLNGARAFSQHPMSKFPHTFLNLEGAGAGGRAAMFRSTDTEVTKAYMNSRYPFASVLSGDAFKRGIVRSETDYLVFTENLGFRGLDIAFIEPRSRYHTDQDDTKHTSIDSIWHMLSAAISTMDALTSGSALKKRETGNEKNKASPGTDAVWFDLFGQAIAVFQLHTLFAVSVALLVVAPVILILTSVVLSRVDKYYVLSRNKQLRHDHGTELVSLHGWRGFFQLPILLILASAGTIGLAFLIQRLNPYIVYSSAYAVWSMMLSAWFFIAWFASCAADFLRPSALTRLYSLVWLFAIGWIVLVVITIAERRQKIAGSYFLVFDFAAIFLATLVALSELFGLPRKGEYGEEVSPSVVAPASSHRSQSILSGQRLTQSSDEQHDTRQNGDPAAEDDEEATERTSLLRSDRPTTFARYHHEDPETNEEHALDDKKERKVYLGEQPWSWSLPTWPWLLQFLLLSIIPIILIGQVALYLTSALYQTPADGSSPFLPYVAIAIFTILILIPVSPFIHRYTYHIPVFLLLIFIGTLLYNILAFPFSANNRLKVYFQQHIDLDTGINKVALTGIKDGGYLHQITTSLPSTAGQDISCGTSKLRKDLMECTWLGLPPHVVPTPPPLSGIPPPFGYAEWLSFNISRPANSTRNEAVISVAGKNTRACKLLFDTPVSDFSVQGAAATANPSEKIPKEGIKEIRLWSRTWEKPWHVRVRWGEGASSTVRSGFQRQRRQGLNGQVVCLWSDANASGTIPALEEVWRFMPEWAAVSKAGDGLVEGSRAFLV
ncbi:MAG: hypothetical protein L6R37_008055 [Teloschistes peruensis]|nr:MAG: hypothetical protein L6R37_008055 [Teloschistes peruensis]